MCKLGEPGTPPRIVNPPFPWEKKPKAASAVIPDPPTAIQAVQMGEPMSVGCDYVPCPNFGCLITFSTCKHGLVPPGSPPRMVNPPFPWEKKKLPLLVIPSGEHKREDLSHQHSQCPFVAAVELNAALRKNPAPPPIASPAPRQNPVVFQENQVVPSVCTHRFCRFRGFPIGPNCDHTRKPLATLNRKWK